MAKYIVLLLSLLFGGCALVKKTSKTTDIATRSSKNQLESTQLVLKNIGKETQVYTYWNDSGFHQYQLIKEQQYIDSSAQLKATEKQFSKEKQSVKQAEPVKLWVYFVLLLLLLGGFVVYKRSIIPS